MAIALPAHTAQSQESKDSAGDRVKRLEALRARLKDMVDDRQRALGESATIGVAISDPRSGQIVFQHNADTGFAAASNAKIVTAAAALDALGPDFQFQTELLAEEVDPTGRIRGDLYLRGRGNPLFDDNDMHRLVRILKAYGVNRIDGNIVVDNSYFDSEDLPPHFDEQPDETASFRAPIAATSYTFNATTLFVRPSLTGSGPVRIEVEPPSDYVRVVSTATTIKRGRSRLRMTTVEEKDELRIEISGQLRHEVVERRFRKRIPNPALFVGTGLRLALATQGISVRKKDIKLGKTPAEAIALAVHYSPPLAVVVRGMGKYSNNFVAELVLKVLGAETRAPSGEPATWKHGLDAVRDFLRSKVGIQSKDYRYENGSGLFDSNRFTPRQILKVLQYAQREYRWGPDLFASLSISGVDGTLSRRLSESPATQRVRAKTGTLDNASALSGMVAVDGNAPQLFSILINGFDKNHVGLARALQDDIAEELARYLGGS